MSQDLQLNNLCDFCQRLSFSEGPTFFKPFGFYNINGLIQSAKKGCHVCNLIVAELVETQIHDLQQELKDNPQHSDRQLSISNWGFNQDALALNHLPPGEFYQKDVHLVAIHLSLICE